MDPQGPRTENPSGHGFQPPVPAPTFAGGAPGQPDIIKRGLAAFIDFAIIGAVVGILSIPLAIALGGLGMMALGLAGCAAILVRDVALQGRSPGKKLLGLAVVNAQGGPITLQQSVMRNATLCLGFLAFGLRGFPFLGFLLYALLSLAGFVLGCYELYLVATGKPRLGDNLAGGTHVVFQGTPAIAF
jgi:uncharacterized RDD family membrane protein YckC